MPDPTGPNPGGFPGDPNLLSCSSSGCISAQAKVVAARNDIIGTCGSISDLNSRASALLGIAAGLFATAVTIIGGLVGTFGIAATVAVLVGATVASGGLLLVIGVWLAVALIIAALAILAAYIALLIAVAYQQGQLSGKRDTFNAAVKAVVANCPNTCWGDLTMPSC